MKKLLVIAALFALISCNHANQKIRLEFSFDEQKSNMDNNIGIDVAVFDDRLENDSIGTKEFCNYQKINISSEQNLPELLQKEINQQLLKKGFKQGNDKLVEIHIEQLRYKSECGFLLGKSKINILVKVVIANPRSGAKITKNFKSSLNSKHFIISLESTDKEIINNLLEEVVGDILSDDVLIKNLAQ